MAIRKTLVITAIASSFLARGLNSGTFGGTIVIVGIAPNEVVIAADSRILASGEPHDDACKIKALSGAVLFTAVGHAGEGPRTKPLWSVFEDASQAWATVEKQHGSESKQSQMVTSADAWAQTVKLHLAQMIDRNPTGLNDLESDEVTTGIFAGTRDDGKAIFVLSVLRATRTLYGYSVPIRIDPTQEVVRDADGWELRPFGDPTVWKEVQTGQTDRAKQVRAELQRIAERRDANPVEAIAEKIAEASILYSENGKIGGDVDVAAVRNSRVHWVRLKSVCSKN